MRLDGRTLWFSCVLVVGCGGAEPPGSRFPYATNTTTLIGDVDNPSGAVTYRINATPDGTDCLDVEGVCLKPQTECGNDGAVDVLLDEKGQPVDVICYPTDGVAIETFDGKVEHIGNDVVLVLDDIADGADVTEDVTIDGNNVTLYGHGPDTSVIGGNLTLDKNNAVVRGVRVEGNVAINKNNPSIVDCVIEGDLTIQGNNVSIALCEVWGKLVIHGNNTVLVGNRFKTPPEIEGMNTVCNDNRLFTDSNADGAVTENEWGSSIECKRK